jgi:uncharacterized membrane-anchored protein
MATGQLRGQGPLAPARYAASKVPQITAYFWILKLLTTAMGEATSDFMAETINRELAVGLGFLGFVGAMVLQFRVRRYIAVVYWLAVVTVSVFGTMMADVLHVGFHIPYVVTSSCYAVVLAVIFIAWYRSERTLSIHSIRTPRREAFYWATVLITFALGTALGDLTATTFHLGYFASGVMFAVVFLVPALGHWRLGLNSILAFWFAYVLTRPIGASFADWMGVPHSLGGLDWGRGKVSLFFTAFIVILVAYLQFSRTDVEKEQLAGAAGAPARAGPAAGGAGPRQAAPRHRAGRSGRRGQSPQP